MDAKLISTLISKPLNSIYEILGSNLKQVFSNRILEYSVEEYKRNFFCKTLLHRVEPVPLDSFYQPLFIKKYNARDSEKIPTNSPTQLFTTYNKIALIGSAGSGKSTIIRHLITQCYSENYKVPIKIELRYLNDYSESITHYIFTEVFNFYGLGFDNEIISRLLNSGNFVFFFDGYDEINYSHKPRLTRQINAFISRYPYNDYVMSSRPYAEAEAMPLFTNFNVCELVKGEIESFVRKQLPEKEKEVSEKIISTINSNKNESYNSFLSNPLLLSMFILTFQSYAELPENRNVFYRQVFDTLFSLHDSMSKMAYVREKISQLSKEQFETILKLFSYITFFKDKFIFSVGDLNDNLNLIKTHKGIKFDNDNFIYDIQTAIGIITKEGVDYSFPHRSLQEYFAALFIKDLSLENKSEFYSNQYKQIKKEYDLLFHRANLYLLLNELDFSEMILNLSIPSLISLASYADKNIKTLHHEINSLKEHSTNKDYNNSDIIKLKKLEKQLNRIYEDSYVYLYRMLTLLFRAHIKHPQLFEQTTKVKASEADYDWTPIPDDLIMIESVSYFIDNINSIIETVKNEIIHENTSDMKILGLV